MKLTEEQLKDAIRECLQELGVEVTGTISDPYRRSYSDLGTDMAPLLMKRIKGLLA